MKKFYTIGLILIALIISQQAFPQKENTKGNLIDEQQIELSEGYSFISSRIIAENPDMQDVLQNNLANLEFVRNSAGLMLRKIGPTWVNSIGDWVNTEGYLFKMSTGDELIITGDVIDPQTPVELSTGYQIIGYLPDEALNTEEIFQDILENLEFVRNTAGLMLRKIGPNWVNSIGDMQPGEGYLVKMLADDILIYPGSSSFTCGDPFTDPRDEQTYNTVQIGDQCWMAENLNIGLMINVTVNMSDNGIIEKYCYDNDPANCETYGGLYQWNEIMEYTTTPSVQGICPVGWYIPTDDEWTILTDYLGGEDVAGGKMKETGTTHWSSPNSGATNESGFTGLPGGYRYAWDHFNNITYDGTFWSSSEDYGNYAWSRFLSYFYACIEHLPYNMLQGFSVRCLKDGTTPLNQPPEPPSSPTPANGAEYQTIEVDLSWTCIDPDGDPLTYDIYFGTINPPPLVATGQTETTYDPGTLENIKEYFWMIVAHDDHNNSTVGPVWNFITETENTHPPCPGIPTVTYEGQVYNTVLIGNQCWLKENLNVGTMINGSNNQTNNSVIEKYCYDNNTANCAEYGGLYQWNEMMGYSTTPGVQGVCPSGWHLPTEGEWTILVDYLGGVYAASGKMKETGTTHWQSPNVGATNESGFTALPGGYRHPSFLFKNLTTYAYFWSSEYVDEYSARSLFFVHYINEIFYGNSDYEGGYSVRCMKGAPPVNQPPNPPELPIPEDGAVNQPIESELSWDCTDPEGDPLTYDIYFGTVNPPPLVYSGQSLTTYYPGILDANTEYFWWIMAHDNHSNSTYGPDWSFTTGNGPCPGTPTVTYEGQVYNTILIGEQCWLKENLNVGIMINVNPTNNGVIEKYCYNDSIANCDEYGGLYQWAEMMQYVTDTAIQGICPAGWHLPTDGEWTILTNHLGGENVAGGKMKEMGTTHWDPPNTAATNESVFTALPGGYNYAPSHSAFLGSRASFWSSSLCSYFNAWSREMYHDGGYVSRKSCSRQEGLSVRCLKD